MILVVDGDCLPETGSSRRNPPPVSTSFVLVLSVDVLLTLAGTTWQSL